MMYVAQGLRVFKCRIPFITAVVSKLIAIVGTKTMLVNKMTEQEAKLVIIYETVEGDVNSLHIIL
jgi:hypothetical protein